MAPRFRSVLVVILASILPFSFLIFDAVHGHLAQDAVEYLTGEKQGEWSFELNVETIPLINIQVHAIITCLLLILSDKFLTTQRLYSQRVRDTSCTLATVIFALQPGRAEYVNDTRLSSLPKIQSVCFCLAGTILYFDFVVRKGSMVCTILLCVISAICVIIGTALDISSLSVPLVLTGAIMFEQIKCTAPIYRIIIWSAVCFICLIALLVEYRSILGNTNTNTISSTNTGTSTSTSTIMNIMENNRILSFGYQTLQNSISEKVQIITIFMTNFSTSLRFMTVTQIINYCINYCLRAPSAILFYSAQFIKDSDSIKLTLKFLILIAFLKCVWGVIRYRTMSNLNFSCLAFIVLITVACAPSDLGADGDLLHFDTLAISMQSYIPSCFLSFCLGKRRVLYRI